MANTFLTSLFEHKAWCNAGLVDALRAAQGQADAMSLITMLMTFQHTHLVDRAFRARLEDRQPELDAVVGQTMPDLDALAIAMAETDAWYVRYTAEVSEAELGRVVEFAYLIDGEPGRMTKADILGHIVTHGHSHRAQINKMLGDLKLKGASDMMTTFRRPAGP